MKIAAFVLAAALLLLIGAWVIVLPEPYLQAMIENSLNNADLRVEVSGLRRGMLYDVSADRIALVKDGKELLAVEKVRGRVNPFSLFLLRLDMHVTAVLGTGGLTGRVDLARGRRNIRVHVKDANLKDIPYFGLLGINGSGGLSGTARIDDRSGEVRFDVADARVNSVTVGGVSIALNFFETARGALSVAGGKVNVTSFALEGKDIYARVKGQVAAGKLDLAMEVMPRQPFIEKNPAVALLEQYKVSPGYYVIPFKGDIPF